LDHEEFRRLGYSIIDWIADYMAHGYDGPVAPDVSPGDLLAQLPAAPPEASEPGEAVFEDFKRLVLPGVTHWNDPRFFGYFPCNHSGPGILGDLLSAGLGVNAMSWATSPAATELEIRMMDWLGQMIGLDWPGCIQETASTGTICAALSARERMAHVNRDGFYGKKPLVAYTSEHANSAVIKAVWIAGFGDKYLRMIPARSDYAMDPAALAAQIERDTADGLAPCLVIPTVGTTSSTAVDPVADIAEACAGRNIWLHVDAAMAGSAAILPEMRWLMAGVDRADSFSFNPHKWLFTNFDCSAYFCKEPRHLKQALSIQPEFLKTDHDGVAENFRDWSLQLGRRFRALKLWFVIRCYGVAGLQEKIRLHLRMARWLADQIEAHPGLTLAVQPRLNTVCFHAKDDAATEALMRAVNESGEAFLTHTRLDGRYIIRVSFGQTHSRMAHAERLWALIADRLQTQTG